MGPGVIDRGRHADVVSSCSEASSARDRTGRRVSDGLQNEYQKGAQPDFRISWLCRVEFSVSERLPRPCGMANHVASGIVLRTRAPRGRSSLSGKLPAWGVPQERCWIIRLTVTYLRRSAPGASTK